MTDRSARPEGPGIRATISRPNARIAVINRGPIDPWQARLWDVFRSLGEIWWRLTEIQRLPYGKR